MSMFKDKDGREFLLSVNITTVKRVRTLLGVDLLNISEGDPPLVMRLGTDPVLLVDVVYALIKPELDAANITDEQFGINLGGEGYPQAEKAFWDELEAFFRGLRRLDLVSVLDKSKVAIRTMVDVGREEVEAEDVAAKVRQGMRDLVNSMKARTATARTSGNSSTISPALPESPTPDL